MHASMLCSALVEIVFLGGVNAAAQACSGKISQNCPEPGIIMTARGEDDVALLQGGGAFLRSKVHDHGDYPSAKDERNDRHRKNEHTDHDHGKASVYAYHKGSNQKHENHKKKGSYTKKELKYDDKSRHGKADVEGLLKGIFKGLSKSDSYAKRDIKYDGKSYAKKDIKYDGKSKQDEAVKGLVNGIFKRLSHDHIAHEQKKGKMDEKEALEVLKKHANTRKRRFMKHLDSRKRRFMKDWDTRKRRFAKDWDTRKRRFVKKMQARKRRFAKGMLKSLSKYDTTSSYDGENKDKAADAERSKKHSDSYSRTNNKKDKLDDYSKMGNAKTSKSKRDGYLGQRKNAP